jgi:hypothetical protein
LGLLADLKQSIFQGELRYSALVPIILDVLGHEKELEPTENCDLFFLITGIRLSDEYYVNVIESAGDRDWQEDFVQVTVPILVGVTHTLKRSAVSQSLVIKLCNMIAQKLRLSLIWPVEARKYNDLANAIYKACIQATELASDDVFLKMKGLKVIGPK